MFRQVFHRQHTGQSATSSRRWLGGTSRDGSSVDVSGDTAYDSYESVGPKGLTPPIDRPGNSSYRPVGSEDVALDDLRRPPQSYARQSNATGFFAVLGWWLPELLASVLSVATFLAIVLVLRRYNNRPLTDLTLPHHLTLNGLIAVLATLNRVFLLAPVGSGVMQELWLYYASEAQKSSNSSRLNDAALFDSASRGALGSAIFIVQSRGRRWVACVGALITILSLAFGTFTQQLVAFNNLVPADPTSAPAPPNLPRTESFSDYQGNPAEGFTQGRYTQGPGPPFDIVAAFYSGVLGGGVQPLTGDCPTGNCTWPLTPSLAICGGCANTTHEYTGPNCYDICTDDTISMTPAKNCTSRIPQFYCNYTMPSGNNATLLNYTYQEEYSTLAAPSFQSMTGSYGAHFNSSFTPYIANFDMFGAQFNSYSSENLTYSASECALWFCVQTYNNSIVDNVQQQKVVETIQEFESDPSSYQTFPPVDPTADPNNKTSFSVATDTVALLVFQEYFANVLAGSVGLMESSQLFSSDLMKGVWNGSTDPDTWIQNVATSMTNVVRVTNSTLRPEYNGTAYQLGVSVRWTWLILPGLLVVLSMAFLAAVMIRTAHSSVQAWKTSPLTLLLFDVDEQMKEAVFGQAQKYGGLEKAVGNQRVRLTERSGGTWKFEAH